MRQDLATARDLRRRTCPSELLHGYQDCSHRRWWGANDMRHRNVYLHRLPKRFQELIPNLTAKRHPELLADSKTWTPVPIDERWDQ